MANSPPDGTDAASLMGRWIQAWTTQDDAEIARLFSPDYAVNGVRIGTEGVARSVRFLHAVFGGASMTVHDLIAAGDRIVLRWTLTGVQQAPFLGVPPTGRQVMLNGTNIYRLADGRIAENWENVDVYGALRQLGAVVMMPERDQDQ